MADTDKKYIPEAVFLVCDKGTVPTQLACDPHPINLYGVRYADENDNKPLVNIPSFGQCKVGGACAPPPGLKWTKLKEDVRLHGAKPLLEDSECLCLKGGIIKIFFDGYDASVAAENNNESAFVKEPISSAVLGMLGSGIFGMISPEYRDGVGRGLKKGLEGTWDFITHDIWQGETWVGMGKMAVIAAAYGTPTGAFTGDATLRALDSRFGTDFTQTKDAIVSGVSTAASNAAENVRRGNWGEVGEDVGQIQYAVIEAVAGSKGAGLALKGAKAGATMAVGAQRAAQIAARSAQAMQRLRSGVAGIVKVGRKVDDAADVAKLRPEMRSGTSMGKMDAPRTPGLGPVSTMDDLLRMRGVPGREGVILNQRTVKYADMWRLSNDTGVEYVLTRENGKFVLRSGAPDRVSFPAGTRPIAHTHPPDALGTFETLPSRADINTLNDLWGMNPNGPRPRSIVIWGPEPGNTTPFGATGIDRLPARNPNRRAR